ncbi:adp-ribosylation factor [Plasmopara halstedii]|uniref:Adp-ribosylation factor n=1 Tax=Plasmopara halstedii TaxID=4781 RepID=A0A0P1AV49_PLAHL|nr:adp-ribosylation factor [Plasmopara halstedii]CEG45372.1 adp-ribosylation factor [Plasmopara halstedii]|eukprot:XP_024581741.1 adp-ribosylation factor [Plasmopara halstedii]
MGNIFSFSLQTLYGSLTSYFGNRESRITIIGLDAAGKTTLLYKIKLGERINTIPTIGFNVETFEYENITFTAWDIGGQEKIRSLWQHYISNNEAVIFVVDAADLERIDEAKQALHLIFEAEELANSKLLIYANKQDQPCALTAEELRERMELADLTTDATFVQPCVATTGDGIYEGLDWLVKAITGQLST